MKVTKTCVAKLSIFLPTTQGDGKTPCDPQLREEFRAKVVSRLCDWGGGCSAQIVKGVWVNTDTGNVDHEESEELFSFVPLEKINKIDNILAYLLQDMKEVLRQNATLAVFDGVSYICD